MTRTTKKYKKLPGILYVILVELEDKQLVKIGVTHRRIEERVSEILSDIFRKYRFFPFCKPKRFRTTSTPYEKEKALHKHFSAHKYKPAKKFNGSTEFFDVPLEDVVVVYDKVVSNTKAVPKKKGVFFSVNKNV